MVVGIDISVGIVVLVVVVDDVVVFGISVVVVLVVVAIEMAGVVVSTDADGVLGIAGTEGIV